MLIAIKMVTGLATGSLGLLTEAAHSGTDLVAALLTFFAVGVAGRPADPGHPYGHGKAEHLAALAEASILVVAALLIAAGAAQRLVEGTFEVDATWYAFVVICVVIAIDAGRATVSARGARRYTSPALATNALHFGSDLAGSVAVFSGLLAARAGYPEGWGVGRHVLGSNYFRYVQDPWGSYAEYSYDIDFVAPGAEWPAADHPPEDALYVWGPDVPRDFVVNHEIHAA